MKSEWRVLSNPVGGEIIYGVYRLIDTAKVMCSGNIETFHYFEDKPVAEAVAERLNQLNQEEAGV